MNITTFYEGFQFLNKTLFTYILNTSDYNVNNNNNSINIDVKSLNIDDNVIICFFIFIGSIILFSFIEALYNNIHRIIKGLYFVFKWIIIIITMILFLYQLCHSLCGTTIHNSFVNDLMEIINQITNYIMYIRTLILKNTELQNDIGELFPKNPSLFFIY
jgi:hypothetical protein